MRSRRNTSGQALLILLLAMATITTVTLSIVSRSVSEVEITNKEEDSLRAFTAAEAGIEESLVNVSLGTTVNQDIQTPAGGSDVTISNYQADVTGFPEQASEYSYPFELLSGDTAAVWFITKDGNTVLPCNSDSSPCFNGSNLTLCWGDSTTPINSQTPAAEVTFYYATSGNNINTAKTVFDPNSGRRSSNHFEATDGVASCTVAHEAYKFQKTINLATDLGLPTAPGDIKMMKVRLLYNSSPHSFGISSVGGQFPSQGKLVTSTGQSGNATRKIEAYLINATTPSIFDSAVYSGTDITK